MMCNNRLAACRSKNGSPEFCKSGPNKKKLPQLPQAFLQNSEQKQAVEFGKVFGKYLPNSTACFCSKFRRYARGSFFFQTTLAKLWGGKKYEIKIEQMKNSSHFLCFDSEISF